MAERMGIAVWPVQARVRMHAPAQAVVGRTSGIVEPVDDHTCLLTLGGVSLNGLASVFGMLDVDFDVIDPPALNDAVRRLADRYRRAAP
jgi:hypothetical protein